MGLTPLWRESSALSSQRSNFPTSFWTSSYQPPPAPCLGGVHPDFQVTAPPGTFTAADPSPWSAHPTATCMMYTCGTTTPIPTCTTATIIIITITTTTLLLALLWIHPTVPC
ncbi:Transcription cofactor vestigial-like protein 3 [Heterocephalus glaber]|uniref:Transcription cofactor vestigial-like protein 3 n=1 Tax=Heterocephalus glaber TaxID=10181 RepID=G5BGL9_HETGA|nr:Transcription cofactor vestigial-like protein 3 [Heterocephalus glaber]